jgi:hypothetical protein
MNCQVTTRKFKNGQSNCLASMIGEIVENTVEMLALTAHPLRRADCRCRSTLLVARGLWVSKPDSMQERTPTLADGKRPFSPVRDQRSEAH